MLITAAGCSGGHTEAEATPDPTRLAGLEVPAEYRDGETLFEANCAKCHGEMGLGTEQGPPFLNHIYEPSHHGDLAFVNAAANGVRPHHWGFGPMPPIDGVSEDEVTEIVGYVRWLQRQVGIE
jgi:cytochrome c